MSRALLVACAALATACVPNPTYLADRDPQAVAQVADAQGGEVFARAAWYPYVDGYASTRDGSGGPRGHIKGALVLTEREIVFVIWDGNLGRAEAVKRIAYADVREVALDRLGLSALVVVRQPRREVHSFGFAGLGVDPGNVAGAERAMNALKARIERGSGR